MIAEAMSTDSDPTLEGHERCLLAAQGYSELGMLDEALEELDGLPPKVRKHPAALELRLLVRMQERDWKAALKVSQELCQVAPDRSAGYIHSAFCFHELGDTQKVDVELISSGSLSVDLALGCAGRPLAASLNGEG